jgi:hypothetical protein
LSQTLLVVLMVLGFAVVAGAGVALTVRSGGAWQKRLEDILLPLGFVPCADAGQRAALAQHLTLLNPRHAGKRLLMHAWQRGGGGADPAVYVCDYHFASAGGRGTGGAWLVVCLVHEKLALPHVVIQALPDGSGTAARLMRSLVDAMTPPGLQRVPTVNPALDQRFRVYAPAGVTPPSVLLDVLSKSTQGSCLDARGPLLALSSVGMMADRVRNERIRPMERVRPNPAWVATPG